ncbi:PilZ domain-containing protein [Desulfobulbus oligotrophicus]|uniref:PilZ domain-containing protein n=1 Tax=Desulfobulbus oligotrophicus TaxID=1909699 RepID=A0A7T5VF57_9BACT|nr:PilZ domain-containing protein [Desulfobulbus oligotrophicus]QQG66777.1 PilZ domain-containing protein [Desulfobulbus oligotrophicus]
MNTGERRKAQRISFVGTAVLRHGENQTLETAVDTHNISLAGVFLETPQRLTLDTPCEVEIHLTGTTSSMEFRAQGVVRRHDAVGMGVAFTHLDPDSYLHILNLVKLHAAV